MVLIFQHSAPFVNHLASRGPESVIVRSASAPTLAILPQTKDVHRQPVCMHGGIIIYAVGHRSPPSKGRTEAVGHPVGVGLSSDAGNEQGLEDPSCSPPRDDFSPFSPL